MDYFYTLPYGPPPGKLQAAAVCSAAGRVKLAGMDCHCTFTLLGHCPADCSLQAESGRATDG
jgi:hypothetical protein